MLQITPSGRYETSAPPPNTLFDRTSSEASSNRPLASRDDLNRDERAAVRSGLIIAGTAAIAFAGAILALRVAGHETPDLLARTSQSSVQSDQQAGGR